MIIRTSIDTIMICSQENFRKHQTSEEQGNKEEEEFIFQRTFHWHWQMSIDIGVFMLLKLPIILIGLLMSQHE